MTATNHLGFCVEIYDKRIGWMRESEVFDTMEQAEAELVRAPNDGHERRAYEALK